MAPATRAPAHHPRTSPVPRAVSARLVLAGLAFALASLLAPPTYAHPLSPSLLRLSCDRGTCDAVFRTTGDAPTLRLPPEGRVELLSSMRIEEAFERHERWHCAPSDASFALIPESSAPPLLVSFRAGPTGDTTLTLLDAAHPEHPLLLTPPNGLDLFVRWVLLGMEHLAIGADHVIVVVAFVMLIGLRKRLIVTLTAFTLGHSISLALAATGVVTLPSRLVETAIALSIVALALDLATSRATATAPPTERRWGPWLAGAIGLVHGLGFAGALAELSLPSAHIAEALLGFNLGLELAQLTLVALLAILALAARALPTATRPRAALVVGWAIGILGATWTLERAFL